MEVRGGGNWIVDPGSVIEEVDRDLLIESVRLGEHSRVCGNGVRFH